jgi:hypothetical protein
MKIRHILGVLMAGIASVGATYSSEANAALVGVTCSVTSVGWREDIKAMRLICGGTTFWNREAVANPSCTFKTSIDTIKLFQTTANSALLSGKSVQMYYETQSGCSADLVVREMYLLN